MKLITIKLTASQFEALHKVEQATGKNKSELVRAGLGIIGSRIGIEFPQNVAQRGKYERPQTLEEN